MSRMAMRTAIREYFAEAGLQYVGVVHSARPEIVSEEDYETNRFGEAVPSANGSSAVLVVNLPSDDRVRRADTGRGAVNDSHVYKASIEVFFASTGGSAVAAQNDYDTVVNGMVNLIRADATLGNPDVVWSAGEYDVGIQHQQGEPFTDSDGLTVFISGLVVFDAWEWIAGPV